MASPIVFTHTGIAKHLELAIEQARSVCPSTDIVLLGNAENETISGIDHHEHLSDYFDTAHQFASVYQHDSPNYPDYELFCFQRWFALRDWMIRSGVHSVWTMDSDILLFEDLGVLESHYPEEMSFNRFSGHTALIRSVNALDCYLDLATSLYRVPGMLAETKSKMGMGFGQKGICDMSVFWLLREQDPNLGELLEPREAYAFDDTLATTTYFHGEDVKEIRWQAGLPMAQHRRTDQWVKMATLHFQGNLKRRMESFLPQRRRVGLFRSVRHEWWSIKRRLLRKLPVQNSFGSLQKDRPVEGSFSASKEAA